MTEVITDNGIYFYRIEAGWRGFPYRLFLYKKVISKVPIRKYLFFKTGEFREVIKYNQIQNPREVDGYWRVEQSWSKKGKIENIKNTINNAIDELECIDPQWDGIMISDKAKLRELLIDDLLDEGGDR